MSFWVKVTEGHKQVDLGWCRAILALKGDVETDNRMAGDFGLLGERSALEGHVALGSRIPHDAGRLWLLCVQFLVGREMILYILSPCNRPFVFLASRKILGLGGGVIAPRVADPKHEVHWGDFAWDRPASIIDPLEEGIQEGFLDGDFRVEVEWSVVAADEKSEIFEFGRHRHEPEDIAAKVEMDGTLEKTSLTGKLTIESIGFISGIAVSYIPSWRR